MSEADAPLTAHRARVDAALTALGLGWEAWPRVLTDRRLDPEVRLSGLLVLLAAGEPARRSGPRVLWFSVEMLTDPERDWLGRDRQPWDHLSRVRLPWTATTATTALESLRGQAYDDRRVALALRGAAAVCADGAADAALLEALTRTAAGLDGAADEEPRVVELRHLARRTLASATPPELLDLSLLVDGDTWSGPARAAARARPADEVTALVRVLSGLGPRRPAQRWWREVGALLEPATSPARALLREWVELAARADVVPEWPGSRVGWCCGVLFVGTNVDVVRAAVLATAALPAETWPAEHLGVIARRGAEHNGMAGMAEALSLKTASAAIDALVRRGGADDRRVLTELRYALRRKDLLKRVVAALEED
ncbi:hypothetical protein [Pimelobacter simplex]|uniref:hypothetical protein n=1 Tax=Nocardioides simplex TaxID=2045 RepID=UPI0008F1C638|nr:hypothetical protein [Pimelobacter simplex]GEB12030.1 hypothetical protein NSI01_03450 [Pimelobacter simplex]SFN04720.1 hypothetical protein SAMN05421671_4891 [Pimelobacter simplex]